VSLADYTEPLAWEMAVWLETFFSPDCPARELGTLSMDVTSGLRSLAILQLLTRDDRVHFFRNLAQSAAVRLHYLSRLHKAGIGDDHHQASARYKPLLDAVAAGKFDIARRIADLSPTGFRDGHEYIDDFCFAQILMRLISNKADESQFRALFDQYKAYLAGDRDPRYDLARALIQVNQYGFDNAFRELLRKRLIEIETLRKKGQIEDAHIAADRLIFVDGLAILPNLNSELRTDWQQHDVSH
jgi:hypothetical protein